MAIPQVIGRAALCVMAFAPLTPVAFAQEPAGAAQAAKPAMKKPLVVVNRLIEGKKSLGGTNRIEVELMVPSASLEATAVEQGAKPEFAKALKWVNNVKVTLVVGYEPAPRDLAKPEIYQDLLKLKDAGAATKAAGAKFEKYRYYKATATVLSLEANQKKSVFFYLPADVVKRDGIITPKLAVAYATLEVDGQEVPIFDDKGTLFAGTHGASAGTVKIGKADLDKVREFADRATAETAGVLRPQCLINYFQDPEWSRSPDFVNESK